MADPARTPPRTKKERVTAMRQVCRELPCLPALSGYPPCPFCPHWRNTLKKECDP